MAASKEDIQDLIPQNLQQLRACLFCKLVKTIEQWEERGCENCGQKVEVYEDVKDYTTPKFVG